MLMRSNNAAQGCFQRKSAVERNKVSNYRVRVDLGSGSDFLAGNRRRSLAEIGNIEPFPIAERRLMGGDSSCHVTRRFPRIDQRQSALCDRRNEFMGQVRMR